RLGVLANDGFSGAMQEAATVQAAADALNIAPVPVAIRRKEDIARIFEGLNTRVDALYVCGDPLASTNRYQINVLAVRTPPPTSLSTGVYAKVYGVVSYGATSRTLLRRGAAYIKKVLRGPSPADLPVEQPTKFELVINMTTARALGLKISESFLLR